MLLPISSSVVSDESRYTGGGGGGGGGSGASVWAAVALAAPRAATPLEVSMLSAIHASGCAAWGGGALDAAAAVEPATSETEMIADSKARACRMTDSFK